MENLLKGLLYVYLDIQLLFQKLKELHSHINVNRIPELK